MAVGRVVHRGDVFGAGGPPGRRERARGGDERGARPAPGSCGGSRRARGDPGVAARRLAAAAIGSALGLDPAGLRDRRSAAGGDLSGSPGRRRPVAVPPRPLRRLRLHAGRFGPPQRRRHRPHTAALTGFLARSCVADVEVRDQGVVEEAEHLEQGGFPDTVGADENAEIGQVLCLCLGCARGRDRTDTSLRSRPFKGRVSASFTTRARAPATRLSRGSARGRPLHERGLLLA